MAWHIIFKRTLILCVGTALLFSCKKAEDRSCWKAKGEDVSLKLDLPDFFLLRLNKKLKYVLREDTANYLVIRGGKNMVKHIGFDFDDEKFLHIQNHNKCNFLRDQTIIPEVEIHYKSFIELRYEGTETLITPDTLHFEHFKFTILDANGSLNMLLDVDSLNGEVAYGMGDYKLAGKARVAQLGIRSNGFGDASALQVTDKLTVLNESPGNLIVNAQGTKLLRAIISGTGNVYYQGIPLQIESNYFSSGRLIAQ